ncbi:MAG: hypothetical protein QCI82_06130 [Candidatus Thermoplasmatota archaeon]|nr:hypothetical protein [Candidatus Thermoplasmatota archaeon]
MSVNLQHPMENNYYQYTVPVDVAGTGIEAVLVYTRSERITDPSCLLEYDGPSNILTMGNGGVIV